MKKFILILVALFTFGFANAQDTKGSSSSGMRFGLKAGLNNTNFSTDPDLNPSSKSSFYFGGLVDFTVSEKFHVQPELLYSDEGADDDGGITYLRLPIMAKFYVAEGFSIQAGPEIAFKIGGDDGVDEVTKGTDFGLGFGAGYELAGGLLFDARYNLGLSNISDVDGLDIKNTGFQVGL